MRGLPSLIEGSLIDGEGFIYGINEGKSLPIYK
jgi:hypothetical protein